MLPYREVIVSHILKHQTVNGKAKSAVSLHPEKLKPTQVLSPISVLTSKNGKRKL
jgi:hypothetical protein